MLRPKFEVARACMKRRADHVAVELAASKYGRILGAPARQVVLPSSEAPSTYRWLWICGCGFDFVDDVNVAEHWKLCANHAWFDGARTG
jgi:hypothetical protein